MLLPGNNKCSLLVGACRDKSTGISSSQLKCSAGAQQPPQRATSGRECNQYALDLGRSRAGAVSLIVHCCAGSCSYKMTTALLALVGSCRVVTDELVEPCMEMLGIGLFESQYPNLTFTS